MSASGSSSRAHRFDRVRLQQHVAAGRHHDRVDDERTEAVPAHAFDHRQHRGAIVEHAGLHGRDPEVAGDGIDLLRHECAAAPAGWPLTPRVFCAVSAVSTLAP